MSPALPVGAGSVAISISIGIALAAPGAAALRLLRSADAALYQAKRSGRDQVAVPDDGSIGAGVNRDEALRLP